MTRIKEFLATFLKLAARSKLAMTGGVMALLIFPVLATVVLLDWQGWLDNPYLNFLFYLVLGPLFVAGIVMVVTGLLFFRGQEEIGLFAYEYVKEQLNMPGRFTRIRRLFYLMSLLTVLLLLLIAITAFSGFRYTDSVQFCAQFCHTVMEPEYVTYQNSSHSRVSCVECHIGAGTEWFTRAKLTGIKQFLAVLTDSYSRPIPTPITGLRPDRATCEQCHRPEKFHGHKLYFIDKFLPDRKNSHLQTVMIMKVGSGGYLGQNAQGVHWHISDRFQVRYTPADQGLHEITRVVLEERDGGRITFVPASTGKKAPAADGEVGEERLMDCMDCHNRPTHVFLSPERALDRKLLTRRIPDELPFIKRQALEAITADYATTQEAMHEISRKIKNWYQDNYPDPAKERNDLLAAAIRGAQEAYRENVFPDMNITWNFYRDFIGHQEGTGCFRCHDGSFVAEQGSRTISHQCDTCHIILAEDQPVEMVLRLMHAWPQQAGIP